MSYILLSFFDEVVDLLFSGIMQFRVSRVAVTGLLGSSVAVSDVLGSDLRMTQLVNIAVIF